MKDYVVPNQVVIFSIEKESVQGRNNYKRSGRNVGRHKAKDAADNYVFNRSKAKGQLNTGFWEMYKNPYKADSVEKAKLPAGWENSDIWKKDEITLQELLEIKHGKTPGFYTSKKPSIFERKGADKTITYIQKFRKKFNQGQTLLNLNLPQDEIAYHLVINHSKIANSERDINPVLHTHYIAQENEVEKNAILREEFYDKATYVKYGIYQNQSGENIKKLAVIMGVVKGDVSVETAKHQINLGISDKTKNHKKNITEMLRIAELLDNAAGKKRFHTEYLLQELVNNRIISVNREEYTWSNAPAPSLVKLGIGKEEVIAWLMEKESAEYRKQLSHELRIKAKIDAK